MTNSKLREEKRVALAMSLDPSHGMAFCAQDPATATRSSFTPE
ncbi:hypothetical protein IEO21_11079 [Rhodonia placenta]|uniref:Uncharacterized protein n=1 Tax=Rhodonia placenta TaxID=104341 RepID=A0A8H7TV55_9APHY|nr:hypothetical protein IEO21_11079 [Postia placenta]